MSEAYPIGKVERGVCQEDCGLNLVLFLIVLSAVALVTFLNDTPAIVVTLRYCFLAIRLLVCSCYSYSWSRSPLSASPSVRSVRKLIFSSPFHFQSPLKLSWDT